MRPSVVTAERGRGGGETLAIIIPVYQDAPALQSLLDQLQQARQAGAEVIVVGSAGDLDSARVAAHGADLYLVAERGRGTQLAFGASHTQREHLWFLHADSRLPERAAESVVSALQMHPWGRFNIAIEPRTVGLRIIAGAMNIRSRWTGIVTGDHALFIRASLYHAAGGFPKIPIMEDIAFCRKLSRTRIAARPYCLRGPIVTSGRKWLRDGLIWTVFSMWRWRMRFWLGASPEQLAREYYPGFATRPNHESTRD